MEDRLREAEAGIRRIVTYHEEYMRECVEGGAEDLDTGVAGKWGQVMAEYDRRGAQLARQAPVVEAARRLAEHDGTEPGPGSDIVRWEARLGAHLRELSAAVRELDRPEVGK